MLDLSNIALKSEEMLGTILVLGILMSWIAKLLKIPSILLLLICGIFLGPVSNLIDPDYLFGNLLYPFITISVGIILFEGGLTLKISDVKEAAPSLTRLLTYSALITWLLASLFAYLLLPLSASTSILFGSLLIVTGPTVVGPLLRHIKPNKKLFSILHWEGILIDPIGALIATLIFEGIVKHQNSGPDGLMLEIAKGIGFTIFIGSALSFSLAWILVSLLRRFLIPDNLQNLVTLMFAVLALLISNYFQPDSGLFTVTLMGIVLANQRKASIHHILEFKEILRVLLIATLFIILSARIKLDQILSLGVGSFVFAASLILLVRPLSVFLALRRSKLQRNELIFLSAMAPRGIVAAAVASIFGEKLGVEGELLMPITFLIIATTVTIYGLGTPLLAKFLKLSNSDPKGVLIIGANFAARRIANALKDCGTNVFILDSDYHLVLDAKMEGLSTIHTHPLEEHSLGKLPISEIGTILILIPDDKESALIAARLRTIFSSKNIYHLTSEKFSEKTTESFLKAGRIFVNDTLHFYHLQSLFSKGAIIRKTKITKEFPFSRLKKELNGKAIILFVIKENLAVTPASNSQTTNASTGDTVMSLELGIEKESVTPIKD